MCKFYSYAYETAAYSLCCWHWHTEHEQMKLICHFLNKIQYFITIYDFKMLYNFTLNPWIERLLCQEMWTIIIFVRKPLDCKHSKFKLGKNSCLGLWNKIFWLLGMNVLPLRTLNFMKPRKFNQAIGGKQKELAPCFRWCSSTTKMVLFMKRPAVWYRTI